VYDLLKMSEDDISQRVFMFDKKARGLSEQKNALEIDIQSALQPCDVFKSMDTDHLPTFRYF